MKDEQEGPQGPKRVQDFGPALRAQGQRPEIEVIDQAGVPEVGNGNGDQAALLQQPFRQGQMVHERVKRSGRQQGQKENEPQEREQKPGHRTNHRRYVASEMGGMGSHHPTYPHERHRPQPHQHGTGHPAQDGQKQGQPRPKGHAHESPIEKANPNRQRGPGQPPLQSPSRHPSHQQHAPDGHQDPYMTQQGLNQRER